MAPQLNATTVCECDDNDGPRSTLTSARTVAWPVMKVAVVMVADFGGGGGGGSAAAAPTSFVMTAAVVVAGSCGVIGGCGSAAAAAVKTGGQVGINQSDEIILTVSFRIVAWD